MYQALWECGEGLAADELKGRGLWEGGGCSTVGPWVKPTSAALLLQLLFPDDLLYMATFVQLAMGFLQLSPQSLAKHRS